MTLQECYTAAQGSYQEALGRLMNDRLIQKFLVKFLDDASYAQLEAAMTAEDQAEAFRAAHTLKGVAQNLALTKLGGSAAALTDALRDGGWGPEVPQLYQQVRADYDMTAQAIRQLAAG